jgi:adenylate cyclase
MIKAQNYSAISVKPKSSDEVGQLTRNFMEMIPHLQARERLREKTEAFINKQVAAMIDGDTLPDHAETKDVTVFFSDVRGFTGMSEKMGDPQVVLDNLSEYFSAMVPCVEATQGTVDKFIGDAVMAVWGSMQDLKNNAENAVNGALMMRDALIRFNAGRGGVTRPFFQIGCGLNSGPATVGIMGEPFTKMEWAHMGDTVNLASRIEALNKPMGTDILISQNTADKVRGIFHLVPMNKIKVKGKTEPQQIYAVLGRMDDDSRPKTLKEMRVMVGIKGNFNKVTVSEEHEVKYEILNS